jgi:hypothetical protein
VGQLVGAAIPKGAHPWLLQFTRQALSGGLQFTRQALSSGLQFTRHRSPAACSSGAWRSHAASRPTVVGTSRVRGSSSPSRPASQRAGSACSSSVPMIASATTLA